MPLPLEQSVCRSRKKYAALSDEVLEIAASIRTLDGLLREEASLPKGARVVVSHFQRHDLRIRYSICGQCFRDGDTQRHAGSYQFVRARGSHATYYCPEALDELAVYDPHRPRLRDANLASSHSLRVNFPRRGRTGR